MKQGIRIQNVRRSFNRLLIAVVVAVVSPAARSQTVLFEDDFSGGIWDPAWVSKWCCQRVVDGWLHSQDTDGWPRDALAVVHDSDTAWTDYTVSLDAEFVPGTAWEFYNIVLRSNGFDRSSAGTSGTAYQLEFTGAPPWERPAIRLTRFRNSYVELYSGGWNPPDGPVALTISLEGGRISLSVNGESVFDVTDPDPLPYGGIGLHTIWESKARFDNVVVTSAKESADLRITKAYLHFAKDQESRGREQTCGDADEPQGRGREPDLEHGKGALDVAEDNDGIDPLSQAVITGGSYCAQKDKDRLRVIGTMDLAEESDGIDPLAEKVTFSAGIHTVEIPAGSFRWWPKAEAYGYVGKYDGGWMTLMLKEQSFAEGLWKYRARFIGVDNSGMTSPMAVKLRVGDDSGETEVNLFGTLGYIAP